MIKKPAFLRRPAFIKFPTDDSLFDGLDERFRHERIAVDELEVLHHLERAFLVLLEVRCLDVVLVGFLARIDFKNREFGRIILFLEAMRSSARPTRSSWIRGRLLQRRSCSLDLRRINADLRETDDVLRVLVACAAAAPAAGASSAAKAGQDRTAAEAAIKAKCLSMMICPS